MPGTQACKTQREYYLLSISNNYQELLLECTFFSMGKLNLQTLSDLS